MASNTKQALLQALSAAEGGYISGQRLAETPSTRPLPPLRPRATRCTPPPAGATG